MLTEKQDAFAKAIASGSNQSDAYRAAYNAEKMKPETVWSNASRLLNDSKVSARIAELKAELAKKALWTREMSVKALIKAYKIAEESGSASGMTGAVKELNLMHGYNEPAEMRLTVVSRPLVAL